MLGRAIVDGVKFDTDGAAVTGCVVGGAGVGEAIGLATGLSAEQLAAQNASNIAARLKYMTVHIVQAYRTVYRRNVKYRHQGRILPNTYL